MKRFVWGLLLVLVVVSTGFAKGKPNGGGGDPIVVAPKEVEIVVDGVLTEWEGCYSIPLFWAGNRNKPELAWVCLRYDAGEGILYVAGAPLDDHVINWKPGSVHMKLDNHKLWEDYDYPSDGIQPEYDVHNLQEYDDGAIRTIDSFEASAYVGPGRYSMVVHISIFPFGDFVEPGSQSSRTLRGLEIILIDPN